MPNDWGWFIYEDMLCNENITIKYKNIYIMDYEKKYKQFLEKQFLEEDAEIDPGWFQRLDNKIDFGNCFATGISNTLLVLGLCISLWRCK